MATDPIVDELHRRAEQIAQFNFDFETFYRDLKGQENLSSQPIQPPPEAPTKRHEHARKKKPQADPEVRVGGGGTGILGDSRLDRLLGLE
jgi:hypothetical protein